MRDAIPRGDRVSAVAATSIAHDRSFATVAELADVAAPAIRDFLVSLPDQPS
ncbi:hypothetical protein [Actinomadura sp. 9N215]|uniref:hypothetical protein n=1 Tax=Actinomadura sp. 9N215 TaxID=3375150 RepID=UPI0037AE57FB